MHGTLEIFTGGGKTLIALACAEHVAKSSEKLRVAIVVPTEALAIQWRESVIQYTNINRSQVGLLGAGGHDDLSSKRVLVCVLNTAAKKLPEIVRATGLDTLLIIDECHRAGAPSFSRVLATSARFILGLSATPDREDVDDDGQPLEYDEQLVGQALGAVVFRFGLREARVAGWLPEFTVHHHGVQLRPSERLQYEQMSREIDNLRDRIRSEGGDASRARQLIAKPGTLGKLASAYIAATAQRKDLLYRANERQRVTETVINNTFAKRPNARVLMFHERIDEAIKLHELLVSSDCVRVGIEHSRLPTAERRATLDRFRDGSLNTLVSVKSLIEGIDVPSADIGISIASSSSVRQRVQSLGRVLRRTFDDSEKTAEMHVVYVANSVDESIYAKEDWSDLTGAAANSYWLWSLDPNQQPQLTPGPPRTPAPTEQQEWERLGCQGPATPEEWLGLQPSHEYSVDTTGSVRNATGTLIANPQHVAAIVQQVRERPGGRFFVTPVHHLVIVREAAPNGQLMVAGVLSEQLVARTENDGAVIDSAILKAGDPYPGMLDKAHGEYHLKQKRGGVIERRSPLGTEWALTEPTSDHLVHNAVVILETWRSLRYSGMKFAINSQWHAWYVEAGEPKFLAQVPDGLAWPIATPKADQ